MSTVCYFFFFNDTATTEIYTLSLHYALPISGSQTRFSFARTAVTKEPFDEVHRAPPAAGDLDRQSKSARSEEHTSELQSRQYLVCRLLLEKKNHDAEHIINLHITHINSHQYN